MSDALILGFDTSAAHCAAALLCGDRVLAVQTVEMRRGQAEALMPMLEAVLAEGGVCWSDLTRIGVGVGPGNFTGIRIAVSTARGLALALEIPAIGVTGFDAIAYDAAGDVVPGVSAPQGQVYVRRAGQAPETVSDDEASALGVTLPPSPEATVVAIARVAAVAAPGVAPAPLYLRAADAAPARDAPPVLLE